VPAPLFALLDPTLSLEDPAIDKNMRQEPFLWYVLGFRRRYAPAVRGCIAAHARAVLIEVTAGAGGGGVAW
jgi:hypothetical protein